MLAKKLLFLGRPACRTTPQFFSFLNAKQAAQLLHLHIILYIYKNTTGLGLGLSLQARRLKKAFYLASTFFSM
jgi:hypothetical protein